MVYIKRRDFLKALAISTISIGTPKAFAETLGFSSIKTTKEKNIKPQIAITIDDGWFDRENIIDIVNYYQVSANFFIIGKVIEEDPKPWIKAIENGHELGCHTYFHSFFSKDTIQKIDADFKLYSKIFKNKLGTENFSSIKYFRYPYADTGNYLNEIYIKNLIKSHGWDISWWDLDLSFEHTPFFSVYKNPMQPLEKFKIYTKQMEYLSNKLQKPTKTSVLLHFKYPDDIVLKDIIEYSLKQGYQIKRLSELQRDKALKS